MRDNILEVLDSTVIKEISQVLFDNVFDEHMPAPEKAYLYRLLKDYKSEFLEWENLAKINLSLGDFNAYLNCADKILELLDMNTNLEAQNDIEQYRLELYESIANNMFDFVPEETFAIAEKTLHNLEKKTSPDKIIDLCNKLIQGCLQNGKYTHALELTHKVLSLLPNSSIDPGATNFNKYFFLMNIVHVEILFNIGAWEECIEVGYNILNVVNQENLEIMKPDYLRVEQFEQIIMDTVGYVALANILQLKGNVRDFLNIVRSDFTNVPHGFDAFVALESLIFGQTPVYDETLLADDNKFSAIIYHIIEAFTRCRHDYKIFAEEIYQAKILAKKYNLLQIELFIDLMIGYAYLKLCSFRKASSIIYHIIKVSNENGLTSLLYIAWLVMSELNMAQGKYIVAKGILKNALIQLEKTDCSNEYLLMLYKYNMYKLLKFKNDEENAQICLAQANYLVKKYGISFEFDTDPEHYVPLIDPDEESFDLSKGFTTAALSEIETLNNQNENEDDNNKQNKSFDETKGNNNIFAENAKDLANIIDTTESEGE